MRHCSGNKESCVTISCSICLLSKDYRYNNKKYISSVLFHLSQCWSRLNLLTLDVSHCVWKWRKNSQFTTFSIAKRAKTFIMHKILTTFVSKFTFLSRFQFFSFFKKIFSFSNETFLIIFQIQWICVWSYILCLKAIKPKKSWNAIVVRFLIVKLASKFFCLKSFCWDFSLGEDITHFGIKVRQSTFR